MSGSRVTRKVTIDSGRRVSTSADFVDQPSNSKTKSVFDRLGVKSTVKKSGKSASKYRKKGERTLDIIGSEEDESYNSEDGENEKKKPFISFTVKKNTLMEESENKLQIKKDKKKLIKDGSDEFVKSKKKKKQREIVTQPIAVYSKPKRNEKDDEDTLEEEKYIQKKKKKLLSPDMQPSKKKRRFVEEENSDEEEYVKKSKNAVRRKSSVTDYHSASENEGKEKKKKKKQKDASEGSKKSKKADDEIIKIKKKSKVSQKSSDDEVSEEERMPKKKSRKQRSPSWSMSDDDEEIEIPKSKVKNFVKAKHKLRKSPSPSPVKERFIKDYSSFESDISFESDEDHKKKQKKGKIKEDFQDTYEEKQHRRHLDQRPQQGFDDRGQRDDFVPRKRNEGYQRDDMYNENPEDRRRVNQFEQRGGMSYDQGWQRQNQYDERNRRNDQRFDDNRSNRGRMNNNNRYDNNREDRGPDYHENRRDDRRQPNEYRPANDNDWNRQGNYNNDDRYQNDRGNYRGRGRGRGRGNYRGGFNQQQNNEGRYNQQRDYGNRIRNNQLNDRLSSDQNMDRFPRHNRYRDNEDLRLRNDQRGKEQQYDLSPIRDPNFIGTISKKRDFESESDDEDEKTTRKRKIIEKKKRPPKEDMSASDVSDAEVKKKQKSKAVKTQEASEHRKVEDKVRSSKVTVDEVDVSKSPKKSVKDKNVTIERKKEEIKDDDEKKRDKKVTHKRVSAVKDMEGSSGRKTPELRESNEKVETEEKKNEKKEERKRDVSVSSVTKDKRERTDKSKNQDDRDKSLDRRRRSPDARRSCTPDSRRGRSPNARESPYKRGRSPEQRGRHRDGSFSKRDSSYNRKDSGNKREKSPNDRNKAIAQPSTIEFAKALDSIPLGEDVYESISDEELDLFDETDEDYKLPQAASVMDVDWSLLSTMNKQQPSQDAESDEAPAYLQKLLPGNVLSEIGYSPALLRKKTLERVQDLCFKATNIEAASLDVSEETKLRTGMAVTVKNVLKQRRARDDLFTKNLIGLRNDLALRRELRKPLDKIGTNYNVFCSAPANPVDYDLFASSVALYEKKQLNDTDPTYVTISSKVGTIVICKS